MWSALCLQCGLGRRSIHARLIGSLASIGERFVVAARHALCKPEWLQPLGGFLPVLDRKTCNGKNVVARFLRQPRFVGQPVAHARLAGVIGCCRQSEIAKTME